MEKDWIFPYENIDKGKKIVIYGAGQMGKALYKQASITGYCKVVLWVDQKAEYLEEQGFPVKLPEEIINCAYDLILIAIDSAQICEHVMDFMISMKVNIDKIWHPFKTENSILHDKLENDIQVCKKDFSMKPDLKHLDIAFIVPKPIKGGGGHRNIFRAVKFLKEFGHDLTVYIIQSEEIAETTKKNVNEWFYKMEDITFINSNGIIGYHDVAVATWWETAYLLRKNNENYRQAFYFVQDYEPYFYEISSNFILAENTYKFGYSHICSGPWCKKILEEKFQAEAICFQFPLDKTIYNMNGKRTKKEKNIIFFAKPEMPRRCFEVGIEALDIFTKKHPEIEIILYGSKILTQWQVPFKATILNIVPTLEDLADLYRNADLGIVFSTTNPSLVPYEMMSCGCPVVDLNLEYALEKYGADSNNVFLVSSLPEEFAQSLEEIIYDEKALKIHIKSGIDWVNREFPSEYEMARIVERGIVSKLETGKMQ